MRWIDAWDQLRWLRGACACHRGLCLLRHLDRLVVKGAAAWVRVVTTTGRPFPAELDLAVLFPVTGLEPVRWEGPSAEFGLNLPPESLCQELEFDGPIK